MSYTNRSSVGSPQFLKHNKLSSDCLRPSLQFDNCRHHSLSQNFNIVSTVLHRYWTVSAKTCNENLSPKSTFVVENQLHGPRHRRSLVEQLVNVTASRVVRDKRWNCLVWHLTTIVVYLWTQRVRTWMDCYHRLTTDCNRTHCMSQFTTIRNNINVFTSCSPIIFIL